MSVRQKGACVGAGVDVACGTNWDDGYYEMAAVVGDAFAIAEIVGTASGNGNGMDIDAAAGVMAGNANPVPSQRPACHTHLRTPRPTYESVGRPSCNI